MIEHDYDFENYFELHRELEALREKFLTQPWVKGLCAKRDEDARNRVPPDGQAYVVSAAQYILVRELFTRCIDDDVRLFGYTLIPGDN